MADLTFIADRPDSWGDALYAWLGHGLMVFAYPVAAHQLQVEMSVEQRVEIAREPLRLLSQRVHAARRCKDIERSANGGHCEHGNSTHSDHFFQCTGELL